MLAQPADVLLTNATIYDGVSTSPATGDVAIHDGSIVAVGKMLRIQLHLKLLHWQNSLSGLH